MAQARPFRRRILALSGFFLFLIVTSASAQDWAKLDTSTPEKLADAVYNYDFFPPPNSAVAAGYTKDKIREISPSFWIMELSTTVPASRYWNNADDAIRVLMRARNPRAMDLMTNRTSTIPLRRLEIAILFNLLKNSLLYRIAYAPTDSRWLDRWSALRDAGKALARDSEDTVLRAYFASMRPPKHVRWTGPRKSCEEIRDKLLETVTHEARSPTGRKIAGIKGRNYLRDFKKLTDQITRLLHDVTVNSEGEIIRLTQGGDLKNLPPPARTKLSEILYMTWEEENARNYANLCPRIYEEGFWNTRYSDGNRIMDRKPQAAPITPLIPRLDFLYPIVGAKALPAEKPRPSRLEKPVSPTPFLSRKAETPNQKERAFDGSLIAIAAGLCLTMVSLLAYLFLKRMDSPSAPAASNKSAKAEMETSACPACKTANRIEAKFCGDCGEKILS